MSEKSDKLLCSILISAHPYILGFGGGVSTFHCKIVTNFKKGSEGLCGVIHTTFHGSKLKRGRGFLSQ
jgi:hypothetical protein